MPSTLTATYELHPPPETPSEGLQSEKTHTFSVDDGKKGKEYYESLREAVAKAKSVLGEELTVWRDAVGTREQTKESKLSKKSEEDEEDEDEQEEQVRPNHCGVGQSSHCFLRSELGILTGRPLRSWCGGLMFALVHSTESRIIEPTQLDIAVQPPCNADAKRIRAV